MRLETPSVNYKLFDESSKKVSEVKIKVDKVSEVESKVKIHKASKAKQVK